MEITYEKRTGVFKDWDDIADGEVFLVEGEPWLAIGKVNAVSLENPEDVKHANGFEGEYEVVHAKIVIYRN